MLDSTVDIVTMLRAVKQGNSLDSHRNKNSSFLLSVQTRSGTRLTSSTIRSGSFL